MRRVIIAGILVGMAMAGHGRAEDGDPGTITVFGSALASVQPDRIIWNVTLYSQDNKLKKAKQLCDDRMDALIVALGSLDVTQEDIRIGQVRIEPVFGKGFEGQRGDFRHHKVSRQLIILQHEIHRHEEIYNALRVDRGLQVRMNYDYSRRLEEADRLRVEALVNARRKAEVLAAIVDAELGPAIEVSEFTPRATNSDIKSTLAMQSGVVSRYLAVPDEIKLEIRMFAVFELRDPTQVAAVKAE